MARRRKAEYEYRPQYVHNELGRNLAFLALAAGILAASAWLFPRVISGEDDPATAPETTEAPEVDDEPDGTDGTGRFEPTTLSADHRWVGSRDEIDPAPPYDVEHRVVLGVEGPDGEIVPAVVIAVSTPGSPPPIEFDPAQVPYDVVPRGDAAYLVSAAEGLDVEHVLVRREDGRELWVTARGLPTDTLLDLVASVTVLDPAAPPPPPPEVVEGAPGGDPPVDDPLAEQGPQDPAANPVAVDPAADPGPDEATADPAVDDPAAVEGPVGEPAGSAEDGSVEGAATDPAVTDSDVTAEGADGEGADGEGADGEGAEGEGAEGEGAEVPAEPLVVTVGAPGALEVLSEGPVTEAERQSVIDNFAVPGQAEGALTVTHISGARDLDPVALAALGGGARLVEVRGTTGVFDGDLIWRERDDLVIELAGQGYSELELLEAADGLFELSPEGLNRRRPPAEEVELVGPTAAPDAEFDVEAAGRPVELVDGVTSDPPFIAGQVVGPVVEVGRIDGTQIDVFTWQRGDGAYRECVGVVGPGVEQVRCLAEEDRVDGPTRVGVVDVEEGLLAGGRVQLYRVPGATSIATAEIAGETVRQRPRQAVAAFAAPDRAPVTVRALDVAGGEIVAPAPVPPDDGDGDGDGEAEG